MRTGADVSSVDTVGLVRESQRGVRSVSVGVGIEDEEMDLLYQVKEERELLLREQELIERRMTLQRLIEKLEWLIAARR